MPNEPTVVSGQSKPSEAATVTIDIPYLRNASDLFGQSKHVSNRPCVIPALYTPTGKTEERCETVDSGLKHGPLKSALQSRSIGSP